MAPPVYLANLFNFLETAGVTDCADTITRIVTQATALGWSNPGSGHVRTPPNAVGQYIDLQYNRIAALNLEMVFTDSLSRTFTRRTQMATPYVERLYFNTYGFAFDPANGEGLWGSLLDLSPELQDAHDQFAVGHGARDNGNTLAGNFQTNGSMQLSSASPRVYAGVANTILIPRGDVQPTTPGAGMNNLSQAGSRMWYPVIQVGPASGAIWRMRGRVFQMLFVSDQEPAQTEIVVPVDGASTGTFKILNFPVASAAWQGKMAMRKA
jgi:hypothetical protein